MMKHMKHFKQRGEHILLSKKMLDNMYIKQKMSSREIANEIGYSQRQVMRYLDLFKIPTRSYKENKMPTIKGSHLKEEHKKSISNALINSKKFKASRRWGKRHPLWKGGKSSYRRHKLAEVPLACADCGLTTGRLHVHHIDGNRNHNQLENLVVLCPSCHKIRHRDSN